MDESVITPIDLDIPLYLKDTLSKSSRRKTVRGLIALGVLYLKAVDFYDPLGLRSKVDKLSGDDGLIFYRKDRYVSCRTLHKILTDKEVEPTPERIQFERWIEKSLIRLSTTSEETTTAVDVPKSYHTRFNRLHGQESVMCQHIADIAQELFKEGFLKNNYDRVAIEQLAVEKEWIFWKDKGTICLPEGIRGDWVYQRYYNVASKIWSPGPLPGSAPRAHFTLKGWEEIASVLK